MQPAKQNVSASPLLIIHAHTLTTEHELSYIARSWFHYHVICLLYNCLAQEPRPRDEGKEEKKARKQAIKEERRVGRSVYKVYT